MFPLQLQETEKGTVIRPFHVSSSLTVSDDRH